MSDLVWFIMIGILFGLLGLVFVILGWQIWKKQKMNLIISSHCDKVKDENKQSYCKLFGTGVFAIGIGFLVSGICIPFVQSVFSFIPMTVGLITGTVMIVSSVMKYNK